MAAPFSNAATSKLVFEKSSFCHPKTSHTRVLNSKYFTNTATIIFPCCQNSPDFLSHVDELVAEQQPSYLLHDVPLHHLIDKLFIEAFVKKGHLYVLSDKRHIDTQDCVALLPTGCLILHIRKDTYEQLGLEGKPSEFSGRKPSKYVVAVDLKPESFAPGRKYYERVLWCLKDRLDLKFDLLVSWTPHEEKIDSCSVAKYFLSKGYSVSPVPWSISTCWLNGVQTPVIDSSTVRATESACGAEELWEWLGATACDVDMSDCGPDSYLSTLSCPSPSLQRGRCCVVNITGFLTPALIIWLLEKLRCDLELDNTSCGWFSLALHGFHDAPVSSSSQEHGYFQNGDNIHCFVVFANKDYWLYSAYGHHDLCR